MFFFRFSETGSSELFRHISRYPGKIRFFSAAPLKKVYKNGIFRVQNLHFTTVSTQNEESADDTQIPIGSRLETSVHWYNKIFRPTFLGGIVALRPGGVRRTQNRKKNSGPRPYMYESPTM